MYFLTGFEHDELVQVLEAWPEAVFSTEPSPEPVHMQWIAVNNVLNKLIALPMTVGRGLRRSSASVRRYADAIE